MNPSLIICVLSIAVILMTSTGCIELNKEQAGELRNESTSVDAGDAKSVYANIQMGIGQLRVSGGGAKLLNASFLYNVASWKPDVAYTVVGDAGNLVVTQPGNRAAGTTVPEGNVTYQWNLVFGDEIPINLKVAQGMGEFFLDLRSISLKGLLVESGTGNVTIYLPQSLESEVNAEIKSGLGSLTLRIPEDVATRVEVRHGIGEVRVSEGLIAQSDGSYVNGKYGSSEIFMNVEVESGLGTVNLELK
jgi:hypothetical protein